MKKKPAVFYLTRYPWGDEAFQKAKKDNKPIFLSGKAFFAVLIHKPLKFITKVTRLGDEPQSIWSSGIWSYQT